MDIDLKRKEIYRKIKKLLIFILVIIIILWSASGIGFSLITILSGFGEIIRFITKDMMPPDLNDIKNLIKPTIDTLLMSFSALGASIIVSLPLAFLSSSITTPNQIIKIITRGFAAVLRTIPEMVWVLILVPSYGLGVMSGTIALFFAGIGLLVRSFTEALEEIDNKPIEALKSIGANWFQIIVRGILPQFLPELLSWSLFSLDNNIRSSAIIGIVGGGGLGFLIQSDLSLFRFGQVTTIIIMMMLIFISVEIITSALRRIIL